MDCGGKKLPKYLTQTRMAHCSATICQQATLSGGAEWPKVADAVIKAHRPYSALRNWRRIGCSHDVMNLSLNASRNNADTDRRGHTGSTGKYEMSGT